MAINRSTRTVHTLTIDVPDDVLGALEIGDQVEVVLVSRSGGTGPKTLTYRDLERLLPKDSYR